MPQVCKVCSHTDTEKIDRAIVEGQPHTRIAKRYGLHHLAIRRHSENHLPAKLVRHVSRKEREHTQDLFANIQNALDEANTILQEARDQKQNRLSLDAIKTILSANELFAKMIAKSKEFENADQQAKDVIAADHVNTGLQVLSTDELRALIQLIGKVHSTNPDYELDETSRMIVNAMNTVRPDNVARNRFPEAKNTKQSPVSASPDQPEPEFDDLDFDDFDLELDDLDLTPSREPASIEEERQRWRTFGMDSPMPGAGRY